MKKQQKLPIILYEEPSGKDNNAIPFPYIEVGKDEEMPSVLFLLEYKHTGEIEPDEKGNDCPIVDQIMHKFIDLEVLKEKLSPELNDVVRVSLGMKPLLEAQKDGQKILDRVFLNHTENEKTITKEKLRQKQEVEKLIKEKVNKK